MNSENALAGTASLFLALGDETRLRLLNLMRDREVCVSSFTGTLRQSQPLISRHLAYLRNSGLVEARRDGKWMHYSISTNLDPNTTRLLGELFNWMEDQARLQKDRTRYLEAYPVAASENISPPTSRKAAPSGRNRRSNAKSGAASAAPLEFEVEPAYESEPDVEFANEGGDARDEFEAETFERTPRHNELEDFLL